MFETRQLWHLVALDDHRHFGKASRTVGISQSALSKSIQRLEEEVGVRLVDRTRKQVAPTAVGEVVIQRARRILSHVEELKREVNLLLGRDTGALAVGIGPAMAESFASVAIARMAELHPKIHVLVRTDHWAQLSQWLFEGKLDLLVADISELRRDRRVNVIHVPTEQLVWFCRRGHPLASCASRDSEGPARVSLGNTKDAALGNPVVCGGHSAKYRTFGT